jgi:hypothetical protein
VGAAAPAAAPSRLAVLWCVPAFHLRDSAGLRTPAREWSGRFACSGLRPSSARSAPRAGQSALRLGRVLVPAPRGTRPPRFGHPSPPSDPSASRSLLVLLLVCPLGGFWAADKFMKNRDFS